MKKETQLKLRNLIERVLREESVPKYVIIAEASGGESIPTIRRQLTFEAAVKLAETFKEKNLSSKNLIFIAVHPWTHGDKFAIIYCTPEYFRSSNFDMDSEEDRLVYRKAMLKYIKTKTTQIGTFSLS